MKKGHKVGYTFGAYGGYQAIRYDSKRKVYFGATESRKDGMAAGYWNYTYMDKVKLTLSIDEQLINLAKQVAKSRKTSVSELVSSYLATFKSIPKLTFEADKLYGIAKSDLSQMSDEEIKALRMKDKYGVWNYLLILT